MAVNFDNDASILAATSQEPQRAGGFRLMMPGAHIPDGEPITSMASELNLDTAQQWCNYVRRVINEREESKNNPRRDGGSVPEGGGAEAAATPGVGGTPRPDDDEPVSETEEALVGSLESRVQRLRSTLDGIEGQLVSLAKQKLACLYSLHRAERALSKLKEAFAEAAVEEEVEERFGGDE